MGWGGGGGGQHVEVAVDDEHGAVVGELPPVVGRAEECQQPALRKVLLRSGLGLGLG